MRVALAEDLDCSPPSSTARAASPISLASSAVRVQSSARSSPASSAASGTASQSASACSRCASASASPEDRLRFACRLDRRDQRVGAATRRLPVPRELRPRRGSAARKLFRQLRVRQLLALTGQDRRADRLRQERVAEAEAAGRLVGDEDAVLDCTQRLAYVTFRKRRDRAEQRVRDVSSGGRRCTKKTLRPAVEPDHALQQELPQAARKLPARRRQRREAPRRRRGCPRRGRRSRSSASPAGTRRCELLAAPTTRRAPAAGGRARTADPERLTRSASGACAPPTTARPRGRWRAAEPPGCRGCARGRQ